MYVAPITTNIIDGDPKMYLPFKVGTDVKYNAPDLTGGTVLLQLSGTYNKQRVRGVVGKAEPEFFNRVLEAVAKAMDFESNYVLYSLQEDATTPEAAVEEKPEALVKEEAEAPAAEPAEKAEDAAEA